jgi:hypothetical protein
MSMMVSSWTVTGPLAEKSSVRLVPTAAASFGFEQMPSISGSVSTVHTAASFPSAVQFSLGSPNSPSAPIPGPPPGHV